MADNVNININMDEFSYKDTDEGVEVTAVGMFDISFNDSIDSSEILDNLDCILVQTALHGDSPPVGQRVNIEVMSVSEGLDTSGYTITTATYRFEHTGTFDKIISDFVIDISTSANGKGYYAQSESVIRITSSLSLDVDFKATRDKANLNIDLKITSNLELSEYNSAPLVDLKLFTTDKKYDTRYLLEDVTSPSLISENMTSTEFTYNSTHVLTKKGNINNLIAELWIVVEDSDMQFYQYSIPADVIFDTYDENGVKGFAIGKFCNEEKSLFECDLPAQFNKLVSGTGIIDCIYPIGSFYDTDNTDFNPNTEWAGTEWELMNDSRFLLSSSASYPVKLNGLANVGGEKTHKLSSSEMPQHNHGVGYRTIGGSGTARYSMVGQTNANREGNVGTSNTGGNKAHNNMPPYRVVNRWHRIG